MIIPQYENIERGSLINSIFSKELLKMLYYHMCRVDIEDNNDKADLITELIGPEFEEVGAGTNRIVYKFTPGPDREFRGGSSLLFIIALDRRGLVD